MSNNFLWVLPYYLLLIAGVVMPSDATHGLLSFKSLAFLAFTLSFFLHLATHQKLAVKQFKLLGALLFFLSFLGAWTLLSDLHNAAPVQSMLDQTKVFLITGFVVASGVYFVNAGCTDFTTLLKIVVFGNFGYSVIKIGLVLGHVLGVLNLFDILGKFGIRFMTMEIIGDFSRLQTSVDILTPYLLFFVFQSDKLQIHFPKGFKTAYYIVSALSIGLSFSRFLLFVAFVSYLLYLITLKGMKFIRVSSVGISLLVFAFALLGWENSTELIQKRFFSSETTASDRIRSEQIEDVLDEFEQYPLLGKGMGTHSPKNVRDADFKYSYEVQWVAFLMQFGLVGVLLMLVPISFMAWQFLMPPLDILRLTFLALFGLWILSGFTNPFLISLTSGIVYLLFYLSSQTLLRINHKLTTESTEKAHRTRRQNTEVRSQDEKFSSDF